MKSAKSEKKFKLTREVTTGKVIKQSTKKTRTYDHPIELREMTKQEKTIKYRNKRLT